MPCPACGADNLPGKRFCGDCGVSLAVLCPACGAESPPGKRFCGDCGAVLEAGLDPAGSSSTGQAARDAGGKGASGHAAERRLVTILFADLVGFTPFAEGRDAEDVRETLSRYFELARLVIGRYGGTVEKFIGDAVMAVWGAPTAREDDAERAVRAGLELVAAIPTLGPGIQARCGVLTGEAAVTLAVDNQGMVAGDIVNTASRLQAAAAAGTVLVGEATRHATAAAIAFEPAGNQMLKGKAAPVPAWRALRVVAERGGRNRSGGLEAPFVGRAEELRLLKDLFHTTGREGRLRLVSVTGPAGIGKSRLAWEFGKYVDGLVEQVWWHDGRCPAYGDGITFWALGEMVRYRCGLAEGDDEATTRSRVADEVTRHVPDEGERRWIEEALLALLGFGSSAPAEELFAAWRTFFERLAATGPVVLVFEDLHVADSGLLDFLDSLIEWSRGVPIYVVTLARPELLDRRPGWGAGVRAFNSLPLDPLPEPAMRELIDGLAPGLPEASARRIVERADGIPLYAVETVRMLVADGRLREQDGVYVPAGDLADLAVPDTLTALIGARLDALAPTDRALVQDAAVLGQSFTVEALTAVSGQNAAALEPRLRGLVRREILAHAVDPRSPERGQYQFVQAMIREVAYATLSRRDRTARHVAAARHFESLGSDELAGAVAGHLVAAHRDAAGPDEAAELAAQARLALSAAAERAASLGAHDQAVMFLLGAVDITDEARVRGALLVRAASSATIGGQYARAEELAARAMDAFRAAGDADGMATALQTRATALIEGGRIDDAAAAVEAALGLDAALAESTRAEVLATASRAYFRAARNSEAIRAADEALAISERLHLDRITAEALVNKGSSLGDTGRLQEPIALLEGARRLASRHGWTSLELRARNNLAATVSGVDYREGNRILKEILPIAERVGDRLSSNSLISNVADDAYWLAEGWDEAIDRVERRLREDLDPTDRASLLRRLVILAVARGRPVDAECAELRALLATLNDAQQVRNTRAVFAFRAYLDGDFDEARALLDGSLGPNQDSDGAAYRLAQVAIQQRDLDRLRELLDYFDHRTTVAIPVWGSARTWVGAAVAALEGRTSEALAGFTEAMAGWNQAGVPMLTATTAFDMAAVLDPAIPEVAAAIEGARTIWAGVGAVGWTARLDRLLAERGSGAPVG